MYSKYTTGHYVQYPESESFAQWRLLYQGWCDPYMKGYGLDEGFAYSYERFRAVVARLQIADPGIAGRDVTKLFRTVCYWANKEYRNRIDLQRARERELVGDFASPVDDTEPDFDREELLQVLRDLSLEDRELLQTCILFAAYYRNGFYKKLAEIYGVTEHAIRAKYREAVSRLRQILDRQGKLGCPASSGGEPDSP